MILCADCGIYLPNEAIFCLHCGTKIRYSYISNTIEKDKVINEHKRNLNPIGVLYENNIDTLQHSNSKEEVEKENNITFSMLNNTNSDLDIPIKSSHKLDILEKLEAYRDKLLRIDRPNRSIMLSKLYTKWSFDLGKIISRDKKLNEKIIENMILRNRPLCIVKDSDDSESAIKDKKNLKTLFRNIIQLERETGRQETYLGYPFLVGPILKDKYIRGPLILFSISIEHRREGRIPGWYIVFSKEKRPQLNKALIEAIRKESTIVFPGPLFDEFDNMIDSFSESKNIESTTTTICNKDSKKNNSTEFVFISELYKVLINNRCPITSYNDNKLIETQHFESLFKGQETIEKQNLHLVNLKIIGNFPQADTSLYKDYEEFTNRIKNNGERNFGIINRLIEKPELHKDDGQDKDQTENKLEIELDDLKPEQLNLVLDSDSSQDSIIVDSEKLNCTVVRGPPGTGKSQAIVNIAANAISKGKKVLIVCQKRAALDVVYQRLDKVGLGKYSSLIHDHNSDRSNLYKHLSIVLTSKTNLEISSIRRLPYIYNEVQEIVYKQKEILHAFQKQYFGGINIHTLYSIAKRDYQKKLDLKDIINQMDFNVLPQITYKIGSFERNFKSFDTEDCPWFHRKNFVEINYNNSERLLYIFDTTIELLKDFDVLVCSSESEQQDLVNALYILKTEKGFFKKMKPNWIHSINTVKRILKLDNNIFSENQKLINDYSIMVQKGKDVWHQILQFSDLLDEEGFKEIKDTFVAGKFDSLSSILFKMRESLKSDFENIYTYDKKKSELSSISKSFFKECSKKLKGEDNWEELLQQEILHHMIEYIENDNPILKTLPFETYYQNRTRLADLLSEQMILTRHKIINTIESQIIKPDKNSRQGTRKNNISIESYLWFKIADDLNKKRRQLPVRKLIEKYQNIIFKLSPCWLASPESISSIFPLQRDIFDLVIFDEASQTAVEKSLPVLYRGKNIVIMGDEKQLRPFDLFHFKNDDDDNKELASSMDDPASSESLLILSKRSYGYRYLDWHYRSKYQELIDFSNHSFYDGHLQIAPNTIKKHIEPPIQWINCSNGIWEDRKNMPETILVVDEIKKILLKNKDMGKKASIGIITFNDVQRNAILDEIDNRKKTDLDFDNLYSEAENLHKHPLDEIPFVKNIENVQGDERDFIIFSIGYAKDSAGIFRIMFGSLNQEGGENRLNVAITRARQQVTIICSFDPNYLDIEETKNDGLKKLKKYLQYAKAISEKDNQKVYNILTSVGTTYLSNPYLEYENILSHIIRNSQLSGKSVKELVYNKLKLLGYDVDINVGNSSYQIDLAVVNPDNPSKYLMALECDGQKFYYAKSVKERDITRPQFLESKGWHVENTWTINWWRNPQRESERLQQKIQELRKMCNNSIYG